MSLSCSCDFDWDGWYYYPPEDFTKLSTKRARKCCSCGTRIAVGDACGEFLRERGPNSYIEERICGEEIQLATWYMCERCAGLYFAFDELGFCVTLGQDSMVDLAKEYGEMQREQIERRKAA